jgi:hypothetical protein
MLKRTLVILGSLVLAAGMVTSLAVAQDQQNEDFEMDHEATEEHQEFQQQTRPGADPFGEEGKMWEMYFDQWDRNNNLTLDELEFRRGFEDEDWFQTWDRDGDETLSPNEVADSYDTWLGPREILGVQSFADRYWDITGDGNVSKHEFVHGVEEYWDYNNDGEIDIQEYEAGLYETLDANDNDEVSKSEWDLIMY